MYRELICIWSLEHCNSRRSQSPSSMPGKREISWMPYLMNLSTTRQNVYSFTSMPLGQHASTWVRSNREWFLYKELRHIELTYWSVRLAPVLTFCRSGTIITYWNCISRLMIHNWGQVPVYTRLLTDWNMTDSSGLVNHYQQGVHQVFFAYSGLVKEMFEVLMFFTDLAFFCRGKQNKHPLEL